MNNLQQNIGMGKHQAGMMQSGSRRGKDTPEPYKRQKKS